VVLPLGDQLANGFRRSCGFSVPTLHSEVGMKRILGALWPNHALAVAAGSARALGRQSLAKKRSGQTHRGLLPSFWSAPGKDHRRVELASASELESSLKPTESGVHGRRSEASARGGWEPRVRKEVSA
jgi:hypothetical protein